MLVEVRDFMLIEKRVDNLFAANWAITKKLRKQKKYFLYRKKIALLFEITIMFILKEDYKYRKEMQTVQLQRRLVPFFN